jgi:hypothetical protein
VIWPLQQSIEYIRKKGIGIFFVYEAMKSIEKVMTWLLYGLS